MKRFLKLPEVRAASGLGMSAIYERGRKGTFPRGFKNGQKGTVWDSDEIEAWQAARLAERGSPVPLRIPRPAQPNKKISKGGAGECAEAPST